MTTLVGTTGLLYRMPLEGLIESHSSHNRKKKKNKFFFFKDHLLDNASLKLRSSALGRMRKSRCGLAPAAAQTPPRLQLR